MISAANLVGQFVIENPILITLLIILLSVGVISIFFIPLLQYIRKKASIANSKVS